MSLNVFHIRQEVMELIQCMKTAKEQHQPKGVGEKDEER